MAPQQQLKVGAPSGTHLPLEPRTFPPQRAFRHPAAFSPFEPNGGNDLRTIRVALAGCGVVGGRFVRLLHESGPAIASRFGVHFSLSRVLVRDLARERNVPLDSHLFTNDLDSFLAEDADVVIEAVGGNEPARTIGATTLARGKKFITANKELVASHGDILSGLARDNETALDFGAAVGGSAPVISTLRDLVGATTPLSVRGILNGTSNYVISQLERGVSFESAIESACLRGLAESDCTRDLDGSDLAAKLAIVGWIAYGIQPGALIVRRTSLLPGLEQLVRFAALAGGRVRFIGECTQLGGHRVAAAVEPVVFAPDSAFARTVLEENRVEVDLGWTSPLSVSGPGAGAAPTAAAILSDLLRDSRPPNDRGRVAAQFISSPDTRKHRWLVAGRLSVSALRSAAETLGLGTDPVGTDREHACVITRAASSDQVQALLNALNSFDAVPCLARYDLAETQEALQ